MDHEDAKKVAERFVRSMETNQVEVFADDVFCDINVPEWRFQMQGADKVAAWLTEEQPDGCSVATWTCEPTASGVVVELEQRIGDDLSRNMHRLEVRDGRIVSWTMYCTGVWSSETQRKQAQEAPMIRP